ncbi:hypothetical protein Bbelb_440820, partial [Branchiostoma belcheri]
RPVKGHIGPCGPGNCFLEQAEGSTSSDEEFYSHMKNGPHMQKSLHKLRQKSKVADFVREGWSESTSEDSEATQIQHSQSLPLGEPSRSRQRDVRDLRADKELVREVDKMLEGMLVSLPRVSRKTASQDKRDPSSGSEGSVHRRSDYTHSHGQRRHREHREQSDRKSRSSTRNPRKTARELVDSGPDTSPLSRPSKSRHTVSSSTPQLMSPRSRLWLQTSYSDSMSGSYPSSGLQPMSSPSRSNSSASLSSMGSLEGLEKSPAVVDKLDRSMKRVSSSSSVSSLGFAYNNVYATVWRTLVQIVQEPHSEVSEAAHVVVNAINLKATMNTQPKFMRDNRLTHSAPSSPTNSLARLPTDKVDRDSNTESPDGAQLQLPHEIARPMAIRPGEQPPPSRPPNPAPIGSAIPHSSNFQSKRRLFDKGPNSTYDDDDDVPSPPTALITTEFCEWSSRYFAQSVMKFPEEHDPQSPVHYDREWRFIRNARVRREAREMQKRAVSMRLDDQIFINRNKGNPTVLKFHPYDPHMAVADKDGISIWNWDEGARTNYFRNNNVVNSRITALDFINSHDITLLLSGSDDGAVRIWREYGWDGECEPELVTAWQAISDLLPSTRGPLQFQNKLLGDQTHTTND